MKQINNFSLPTFNEMKQTEEEQECVQEKENIRKIRVYVQELNNVSTITTAIIKMYTNKKKQN